MGFRTSFAHLREIRFPLNIKHLLHKHALKGMAVHNPRFFSSAVGAQPTSWSSDFRSTRIKQGIKLMNQQLANNQSRKVLAILAPFPSTFRDKLPAQTHPNFYPYSILINPFGRSKLFHPFVAIAVLFLLQLE